MARNPGNGDVAKFHHFVLTQDILCEIQRLKSEASRFMSILASEATVTFEDEERVLSPQKRQTLAREVESLQVNKL